MIYFQKRIKAVDCLNNPDWWFVYGDNLRRFGKGGQAAEMRDAPNALGIATKVSPFEEATDEWFDNFKDEFQKRFTFLMDQKRIVYPADGIGTGLANLQYAAPKIWTLLKDWEMKLFKHHL